MKKNTVLIIVIFIITYSYGEIKLPSLFSDGMVIQRNTAVSIWGLVNPNKKVKITFGDQSHQTIAKEDGSFKIELSPMDASSISRSLVISSENESKKINDVLEVEDWLCTGQNNIHMTIKNKSRCLQMLK